MSRAERVTLFELWVRCARCGETRGPLPGWPAQCPTPGCGDSGTLQRVTRP